MSARSRQTFQQLVTLPDSGIPLAEAALLIACEEYPQLDLEPYLRWLDGVAQKINGRLDSGSTARDRAGRINETLFEDLGFKGNSDNYYDPRNSFLNDVIDRRLGIPITLSTVYLEIARRINLPLSGVGMPGHFIVKYAGADDEFFLDPYNGGEVLTRSDCFARLREAFGDSREFSDQLLARSTHKQILFRMLNNLKAIYLKASTFERAVNVVDMLLMVQPDETDQYRDRGLLRVQLRQFELATRDFETYLKAAPDAEDKDAIESQLNDLSKIRAMMN